MEQTLDAEYYWLFSVTRWQFQKRVQRNKAEPTDSNYDELKAIAMRESEEQQQVEHLSFSEIQAELANLPTLPNFPTKFAKICQNKKSLKYKYQNLKF